jgi:hypothetical protein
MLAEILKKNYHPCVPLYDGLLCPESTVDELVEVCREE